MVTRCFRATGARSSPWGPMESAISTATRIPTVFTPCSKGLLRDCIILIDLHQVGSRLGPSCLDGERLEGLWEPQAASVPLADRLGCTTAKAAKGDAQR